MSELRLTSPDGLLLATLSTAGGILTSLTWRQYHALLYRAPWLDEDIADSDMPPLMKRLAGEWVGVPFGCVSQDDALFRRDAPHGLPVNGEWQVIAQTQSRAALRYDYPENNLLDWLEREVTLAGDGCVNLSLALHARQSCRVPLGLHPIFPVGADAGDVEIVATGHGIVYPQPAEPGASQLSPGARFNSLRSIPATGGTCDVSHLPLPGKREEIVQLLAPEGRVTLRYPRHKLAISLRWDNHRLPHCLLWISNAGRRFAPWSGRNYCLGVEPVCSAWDLGPLSLIDNPIAHHNAATAIALSAGETLRIGWQIRCQEFQ
ncbi:hypothetical protein [Yokenella regensburgei]|uniref:hypothetical protein n=1 Tax=Yokenella regensburgei TaxID=158877 RepID=UPI003ED978C8